MILAHANFHLNLLLLTIVLVAVTIYIDDAAALIIRYVRQKEAEEYLLASNDTLNKNLWDPILQLSRETKKAIS